MRKIVPTYQTPERAIAELGEYLDAIIYHACDGKPNDIKALEKGTFVDMLNVLNLYLKKVKRQNEEIDRINKKLKNG